VRKKTQWSMRISAYAERLLQGLNDIDWSESIKESQRNWIGRCWCNGLVKDIKKKYFSVYNAS
jgi:leucyl-tRNA synthetase